jgi:queuine tRNA-ribosyltransferase
MPAPRFFTLEARDRSGSQARAGTVQTAHGRIPTPMFMPVGTRATVKAVDQGLLLDVVDAPIILGNTYHLYLRPGLDVLERAGGLHRFMGWPRPILTDSGGYQVYSLTQIRKILPEGVRFASHIDGSYHLFTPENVVDKQRSIGSDILMVLDECTPWPCDYDYARRSMALTHRWAAEARAYFRSTPPRYGYRQAQFGIVQGSTYADLRAESARAIADLDFEGNAIGGLAVGEPADLMYEMTALVCGLLPEDKPRYLMGVGTPANIVESIARGVDLMDCVMPTRNARHGYLFTWRGRMNFRNQRYTADLRPIDAQSTSPYSRRYSRAYLRHLLMAEELLGYQIASVHNLAFYLEVVREARRRILAGDFADWCRRVVPALEAKFDED